MCADLVQERSVKESTGNADSKNDSEEEEDVLGPGLYSVALKNGKNTIMLHPWQARLTNALK